MRSARLLLLSISLAALTALSSCGDDAPAEGTPDTSSPPDSASALDTATATDAVPPADAGDAPEPVPDVATGADPGASPDSAVPGGCGDGPACPLEHLCVEPPGICAKTCHDEADCPNPALECDVDEGLCKPKATGPCGDGICDEKEKADPTLCPADCQVGPGPGLSSTEIEVQNPTSGVMWWAKAFYPDDAGPKKRYPAVVAVPGGSGAGSSKTQEEENLAKGGYVVVVFDADGRGKTGGEEDYCGFTHQDGLKALIEAVAALPQVDPARMALSTSSYGVTMGAGVLARYPELPILFLVDYEGPADRNDTGHCDASDTGHITHDCSDDIWWAEREAATFATSIQVPYLRIQRQQDHAQPDNQHAMLMVNSATSQAYGGQGQSPFTRVNDPDMNEPNTTYTEASPPAYFENAKVKLAQKRLEYFAELLAAYGPTPE